MPPALGLEADAPYEAHVLWWDSCTVAVQCPLCLEAESHDIKSEEGEFIWERPVMLTALCRSTGVNYKAVFPWEMDLGWEKNWRARRLDTVGLDLSNLRIEGAWDSTSMAIFGLPFREREDPLFWPVRVTDDHIGNSLQYPNGRHRPKARVNESVRENMKSTGTILGSEMQASRFSPRTVLGDMRLILSERPKNNWIRILAPAATIGGSTLLSPLVLIKSDKTLKHKTVAVLDRRGPYKPVVAVSGWKDFSDGADNILNQEFWSREVRKLVGYIGHQLDANNLDHGIEGRASSSHAEKQLMVYTVRMHRFLTEGFEEDSMAQLNVLPSRQGLREAWIGVDRPPCKNCEEFRERIEDVCQIRFHFVLMKRDSVSKNDGKNDVARQPRTPIRSKTAKPLPLTPPDSGSRSSGEGSQYYEEEEEEEEESLDDFDEDHDLQSPCRQRNLRSLDRRPNLRLFSKPNPSPFSQNLSKRPRREIRGDSDDGSEYSPRPPTATNSTTTPTKRVKRSPNPASKHAKPASQQPPVRTLLGTLFQRRKGAQPRRRRAEKLSVDEIMAAIDDVSDLIAQQEEEDEEGTGRRHEIAQQEARDADSTDSDLPLLPPGRRRMRRMRTRRLERAVVVVKESVVIDLTSD